LEIGKVDIATKQRPENVRCGLESKVDVYFIH